MLLVMNRCYNRRLLTFWILSLACTALTAQDFVMQGWGWNYAQNINGRRYMADLARYIPHLRENGFTYLWVPPFSAGSAGVSSMGYDVRDYYDLGRFSNCRWGQYADYVTLRTMADNHGMNVVADMVYNHRDAGGLETNPAVEGWIENMNYVKVQQGDQPFPSDRVICHLPLGGTSGNGAGTYYIKIRSASGHPNFNGKSYRFTAYTLSTPATGTPLAEVEPNGGGDCGQTSMPLTVGQQVNCTVDDPAGACRVDEFAVTLSAADFNAAGDKLYIRFYNLNGSGGGANLGDMSDHYVYSIWNGATSSDVQSQLVYQTRTNFNTMPSGRGGMNYMNFKPNGAPTQLSGDQDAMYFFYDIDQNVPSTQDTLFEYTRWLWASQGVRGFRVDAVKHFPVSFMSNLLNYMNAHNMNPGLVVGESYDFNPSTLVSWVNAVRGGMTTAARAAIQPRAFDFALRSTLKSVADWGANAPDLFNSGIAHNGGSGFDAVTFVNNHDFRGSGTGDPVTNIVPCYAYLLTDNRLGLPCVFMPDYVSSNIARANINALMKCHTQYIYGSTSVDYLNRWGTPYTGNYSSGSQNRSLIYQLDNNPAGKSVIVAVNFGDTPLQVRHSINGANVSTGTVFTDIFAKNPTAPTITVDNAYYVDLRVAPQDFAVWVEGTNPLIPIDTSAIDFSTSLEQIADIQSEASGLSVQPNPVNDGTVLLGLSDDELQSLNSTNADVYLVNMSGQLVGQNTLPLGVKMPLSLPDNAPAGIYLLILKTNEKSWMTKLVIE